MYAQFLLKPTSEKNVKQRKQTQDMFQLEQSHQHQLGEVLGQHADQGQLNNVQGATLKKEKHQVKVTENT